MNLPTDTAIELVINRVDSAGVVTNAYETVRGVIVGTNLTDCVRGVEGTASGWDAGVVVEYLITADIQNRLVTGLLVEHGQDGIHSTAVFSKLNIAQTYTGGRTFSQTAVFQSGAIITPRVVTTTDDATAVINCDVTEQYELSAVANDTEFTVTGTPKDGQKLLIRYKDAGVAKGLTFTGFTAIGITLPTTTTADKWGYVMSIYNSVGASWHALATGTQA